MTKSRTVVPAKDEEINADENIHLKTGGGENRTNERTNERAENFISRANGKRKSSWKTRPADPTGNRTRYTGRFAAVNTFFPRQSCPVADRNRTDRLKWGNRLKMGR